MPDIEPSIEFPAANSFQSELTALEVTPPASMSSLAFSFQLATSQSRISVDMDPKVFAIRTESYKAARILMPLESSSILSAGYVPNFDLPLKVSKF